LTAEVNEGHCKRLGVESDEGRAETAPTLSNIMEGKAVWELEVTQLNPGDGESFEEYMGARFQTVLNNLWTKKCKREVKSCMRNNTNDNEPKYKENEDGLLQPVPMLGGMWSTKVAGCKSSTNPCTGKTVPGRKEAAKKVKCSNTTKIPGSGKTGSGKADDAKKVKFPNTTKSTGSGKTGSGKEEAVKRVKCDVDDDDDEGKIPCTGKTVPGKAEVPWQKKVKCCNTTKNPGSGKTLSGKAFPDAQEHHGRAMSSEAPKHFPRVCDGYSCCDANNFDSPYIVRSGRLKEPCGSAVVKAMLAVTNRHVAAKGEYEVFHFVPTCSLCSCSSSKCCLRCDDYHSAVRCCDKPRVLKLFVTRAQ